MPQLEIDGKPHDLLKAVVLGRSSTCDITLGDPDTSRRHARVWIEDGQGWIEDLGTQNGTRVNEVRITSKCRLHAGDTIRIGQHRLHFLGDPLPLSEAATMMSPPSAVQPPGAAPVPPVVLDQTFHPDSAARASGTALPAAEAIRPGETPATGHSLANDTWAPTPPAARTGVSAWVLVLVAIISAGLSGLAVWYL